MIGKSSFSRRLAASLAFSAVLGAVSCATSVDSPSDETTEEPCEAPNTECGENKLCVDLQTDAFNCGVCGTSCASGKCMAGVCVSACALPLSDCQGTCVDLQNDSTNCGVCGVSCQAPLVCGSAVCGPACPVGQSSCNAKCVDLQKDPLNCGKCGETCSMEATCNSGQCTDVCSPGLAYCNGACSDLQTDETHCGSCIATCTFDETCEAGKCTAICTAPQEYCSGACVDKKSDLKNCGSCGVVCTTGQTCNSGLCQCQGGVCGSCGVTDLGSVSPQTVMGTTLGGTDVLLGSCTSGGSPEVVYSFTAATDGNYKFDTTGSSYEAAVFILGTACNEIKCSADLSAKVSLNLTANETVYVVVDGDFMSSGNFVLNITNGPTIACPNATLSPLPATETGDTSLLPDGLNGTCGGSNSGDATYSFTAPSAGTYTFDTFGTGFDSVLYVLDGNCNGPELACNDDTAGLQSQVAVTLAANQTVIVVVDGLSADEGPFTLHGSQIVCPIADLGNVVPQTISGTTVGQPDFFSGTCASPDGTEVSYSFTAPTTGSFTFDTIGSALDTVVYVRNGTCGGAELACDDDTNGLSSTVVVNLTMGQTVVVVVDGYGSDSYTLHVN